MKSVVAFWFSLLFVLDLL